MAFSSGTFSRLYSWVDDRDNGVKIRADRMDAEFDGIATGLSTAILKDGTQTITADIPFSGNKITGLGDPTSAQDAATKTYVDTNFQPLDAALTSISGLTLANGDIFYVTGGAIANLAKGSDGDYLKLSSGLPAWETVTPLTVSGSAIQKGDGAGGLTAAVADTDYVAVDGSLVSIGDLDLVAGDIIYASGTDTAARLAKGTDGQVLTLSSGVPAWADASGGGLVFIASTDLSNDATANFTGFDSGSYDAYLFVLQNVVPSADGKLLNVRTSTDGGSNYDAGASDYAWGRRQFSTAAGTMSDTFDPDDIMITIANGVGSDTGENGVSGHLWVLGPHLAQKTIIIFNGGFFDNSGNYVQVAASGVRLSSDDVDAIQFLYLYSSNLESGTITMYGLVNA